jgi:hypothetical protein
VSRFWSKPAFGSWPIGGTRPPDAPQVSALRSALVDGEYVAIPGMVLLELLRGFILPRAGSHRDRYGSS